MIRRPWNESKPRRWDADQRRYCAHFSRIASVLPPRLREFADGFTLHDDRFASLSVIPCLPFGRDALVSVYLYREGFIGVAALLILHFVGLRGATRPPPLNSTIMYFDIEVLPSGVLRLGFMSEDRRSWHVGFRDFDYKVHEYEKTPNKAPEPTPVAVMPRATSGVIEMKLWNQKRSEARVTPATGVAHL